MIHRCEGCGKLWPCREISEWTGLFNYGNQLRCTACHYVRDYGLGHVPRPFSFPSCPSCDPNPQVWEERRTNLELDGYIKPKAGKDVWGCQYVGSRTWYSDSNPDLAVIVAQLLERLPKWILPARRCGCNKCKRGE